MLSNQMHSFTFSKSLLAVLEIGLGNVALSIVLLLFRGLI